MNKDVVFSEFEYAILMGKIEQYTRFLAGSIDKYKKILDLLMEEAIQDEKIRVKLLKLRSDVELYNSQLDSISTETRNVITKLASEFEKTDRVDLPDMETSRIQALLSLFR